MFKLKDLTGPTTVGPGGELPGEQQVGFTRTNQKRDRTPPSEDSMAVIDLSYLIRNFDVKSIL